MFNVCPGCGRYDAEREVPPHEAVAVCRACGHVQPFRRLPLFVLTGASGAGKSTIGLRLPALLPECVVLDSDVLWRPEFATPQDGYRSYRELWLRLVKDVHQSGRSVVLCGAAIPEQFERCVERRYLATIHYLALVCDPETLAMRLAARPRWRRSGEPETVERMQAFNRWLRDDAAGTDPPIALFDTTAASPEQTAAAVAGWVRERLC
ncbi:MAG TPA: AAA family ATPase [Dehalococcoidia bacterium]|jgi:shikimate kinase